MVKVIEGEASESDAENDEEELPREDNKKIRETPTTACGSDPQSKSEAGVNSANVRSPVTAPEVSRHVIQMPCNTIIK